MQPTEDTAAGSHIAGARDSGRCYRRESTSLAFPMSEKGFIVYVKQYAGATSRQSLNMGPNLSTDM